MYYHIKLLTTDNELVTQWVTTDLGSTHACIMATEGVDCERISCSGFNKDMLIDHVNRYLAFGGI